MATINNTIYPQIDPPISDLTSRYGTYPSLINKSSQNTTNLTTDVKTVQDELGKRSSDGIEINNVQTYVSIPGTIVKTLIEFPEYADGKSAIIELDDVMTLSYSVARTKIPVVSLGQTSVGGYALGVKTVAGSVIRSVFSVDNLTEFQSKCYLMNKEEIKKRLDGVNNTVPKGTPLKEEVAFMKDDLAAFNIHIVIVPENSYDANDMVSTRFESIIGCVLINNGQVYSVEDLITESTFSFQAKGVKSTNNIDDFTTGYSQRSSFVAASSLL